MYRIRLHGRGGQGIKTAGRMLGSAFFLSGWEVQDATVYGAERRGAPVYAYVRAHHGPTHERGVIRDPDLVAVVDESLVGIPSAGVLQGLAGRGLLFILSATPATLWQQRLNLPDRVLTLAPPAGAPPIGTLCVGAVARLTGVIDEAALVAAIRQELAGMPVAVVERNLDWARRAYAELAPQAGRVVEGGSGTAVGYAAPDWVDLPLEPAETAAPAIHAALTSLRVPTGLWRTLRPVIDYDRCNRCWWVCSEYCPDGAITVAADGTPHIDYEHCKGCLICVAQCPPHAIPAIPETEASAP
ncbi:MAG: 2-oxoacid:acceptor oxidoreductase family protein [Thiobacillaceae bacterium]